MAESFRRAPLWERQGDLLAQEADSADESCHWDDGIRQGWQVAHIRLSRTVAATLVAGLLLVAGLVALPGTLPSPSFLRGTASLLRLAEAPPAKGDDHKSHPRHEEAPPAKGDDHKSHPTHKEAPPAKGDDHKSDPRHEEPHPHPFPLLSWQEAAKKAEVIEAQLTFAERVALMHGIQSYMDKGIYVGVVPAIERFNIPSLRANDAGQGFRVTQESQWGTVVSWPSSLALAAAWDDDLTREVAGAMAIEYRGKGANVMLGPGVNVHRSCWGGRNWEYLSGEDPYLGSRLATAFVEAVQEEGVMAVAKHFAMNEQETRRETESSEVTEKVAAELYLPPFEAAVKAGAAAMMCSYNRVGGIHSCENEQLLQVVLKGRWHFDGFVMSDWWAGHGVAVPQGLDMEMPGDYRFNANNLQHVREEALRGAVKRILAAVFRLRLDVRPGCELPCETERSSNQRTDKNIQLAARAATDGIVLLQNDGILPLVPRKIRKLAVVGRAADSSDLPNIFDPQGSYYSGGGSGHVYGPHAVSPLRAIRERAAALNIEVLHSSDGNWMPDDSVDAVIVVTGATAGETMDRKSLRVDDPDDDVIDRMATRWPTIVLLEVPGPILTPWRGRVAAILALFLGGEQTGTAWASILFGDTSPSGKLPVTLPVAEADCIRPTDDEIVTYGEGLMTSYRSLSMHAAFPFGHGLAYTTFSYGEPRQVRNACDEFLRCIRLCITNSGKVAGREVVQLYVAFEMEDEPRHVLKGFHKTGLLAPRETEEVLLRLTERDLSTYSETTHAWELRRSVVIHIGASSADIRRSLRLTL